jgi:phosphonate transport system substrate-binding protein
MEPGRKMSFDRGRKLLPAVAAPVFAALALALAACGGGASGEGEGAVSEELGALTVGFVPSQEAANLADTAEPLAEILEEELGVPVEAQVLTSYVGLVEAMGNEQTDIGFLDPLGYVLARDRYPDTEVLYRSVRDGESTYRAQFVVRSDSGIEQLEDLEGTDVAFVDPASTAGYLFPMAHLIEEGLIEEGGAPEEFFGNTVYAGGNDNALVSVYNGEVDVGMSFEDARELLEEEYPDVMEVLEVIEYTEEIPNDTVSVRPGLSEEAVEEIRAALMAANESEEGSEVLYEIYTWDDMEEAEDADYDVVRQTAEALELDLEEVTR